jgi:hypothetical protein
MTHGVTAACSSTLITLHPFRRGNGEGANAYHFLCKPVLKDIWRCISLVNSLVQSQFYVVPVRLRVGETLCLATLTPHVYLRIYMIVVDDTHAYN